jgi:hypothetical protein
MKIKYIIFSLIAAIVIYLIGMLFSDHMGYFGSDYMIYHRSVSNFWNGLDPYIKQFYYLNYFHILVFWMYLLPYTSGFVFFLLITLIMYIIILRSLKTIYDIWWFIGNAIVITLAFISFNVDLWLVFSLVMYQKYSERWFSPFFFILSFFKVTMIIPAFSLVFVNSYFRKKFYWKQLPSLLLVLIIITISSITSTGLYFNVASTEHSNLLIQFTHCIWRSYPIGIFFKIKQFSLKNLKIFWLIYILIELSFGIITILINNYIPTFIQSI